MGVETMLIVGEKFRDLEDDGIQVVLHIAQLGLGKSTIFVDNWLSDVANKKQKAAYFASDGDTLIKSDNYGNSLYILNPLDVLAILEKYVESTIDFQPTTKFIAAGIWLRYMVDYASTNYLNKSLTCIIYHS